MCDYMKKIKIKRCWKKICLRLRKFSANFSLKRAQKKQAIGKCLMWRMSLFVIALASAYGSAIVLFAEGFSSTTGLFGDTYGALNTLFSGLAFAGIIASIWMQHEELKLQREEMIKQSTEMKGQREEFELQRKLSEQHQQERMFLLLFDQLKQADKSFSHNAFKNYIQETFTANHTVNITEFQKFKKYIWQIPNGETRFEDNCLDIFSKSTTDSDVARFLSAFNILYKYIKDTNEDIRDIYFEVLSNYIKPHYKAIIFIYYIATFKNKLEDHPHILKYDRCYRDFYERLMS